MDAQRALTSTAYAPTDIASFLGDKHGRPARPGLSARCPVDISCIPGKRCFWAALPGAATCCQADRLGGNAGGGLGGEGAWEGGLRAALVATAAALKGGLPCTPAACPAGTGILPVHTAGPSYLPAFAAGRRGGGWR